MPEMDGSNFSKKFVQPAPFRSSFLPARGAEEVVIEAINSGADFYLQKGGDPKSQFAELRHKIVQAVDRKAY
jgi:DNA-binding NarL/FixJ family response regulator